MPDGWQKVDVPQGRFIGWGEKGQTVTVDVLDFDPHGGKDFNSNICPQLTGLLVEDCDNWLDKGKRKERIKAGELVHVTAGLVNLKKSLIVADPQRKDLLRMIYADDIKVSDGTVKVFEVYVNRGAGGNTRPSDEGDSVGEDEL